MKLKSKGEGEVCMWSGGGIYKYIIQAYYIYILYIYNIWRNSGWKFSKLDENDKCTDPRGSANFPSLSNRQITIPMYIITNLLKTGDERLLEPQIFCSPAVSLWTSYLNSLSLSFLICKLGIITEPTSKVSRKGRGNNRETVICTEEMLAILISWKIPMSAISNFYWSFFSAKGGIRFY